VEIDKPYWHFQYIDHAEYLIRGDGMEIWVSWPELVAFALVCAYLLGPVFALLLQLRGRTPLHASSVVIDGLAVAFLGPSGAGKSTTGQAFFALEEPAAVAPGTRFPGLRSAGRL
jgi:hypothetical protein